MKSISQLSPREKANFLITNRIPRRLATQFIGWYSKIESPLLAKLSIKLWQCFADDLALNEAKHSQFKSLQECFIRQLKDGLRPINPMPNIVTSPCDAEIGEFGDLAGGTVLQAKGFPYQIADLIPDIHLNSKYRNGKFITLRLKSSMYHRFHAPIDCEVKKVNYISGDTWNVNPIALKKIENLFCKNERAIIELKTGVKNQSITLVPVAAILVASMRFSFLSDTLDMKYKGPNHIPCQAKFNKGDEMGYFQHGSTIILFASKDYQFCSVIKKGGLIKMGQALLTGHKTIDE